MYIFGRSEEIDHWTPNSGSGRKNRGIVLDEISLEENQNGGEISFRDAKLRLKDVPTVEQEQQCKFEVGNKRRSWIFRRNFKLEIASFLL